MKANRPSRLLEEKEKRPQVHISQVKAEGRNATFLKSVKKKHAIGTLQNSEGMPLSSSL